MNRRNQKRLTRYLAEREQISLEQLEGLEIAGWFNYWHMHPDFMSRGNRVRPMVALLVYRLLEKAESLVADRLEPIQVWASLQENTGESAVYLHSPNPYGTPFPHEFEGVEWGVPEPEELRGNIKATHEVGRLRADNQSIYVIRRRN